MKILKKHIAFTCFLTIAGFLCAQNKTAQEIIHIVDRHARSDSSELSLTMEVFTSEGSTPRTFSITSYENRDAYSLMEFTEPRTVRGMRILTRDNTNWVFFPSTGRVRKIASGSRSGSVQGVGGDFSYGDLANDSWEESYTWTLQNEFDDAWLLEGERKDSEAAYDRVQLRVGKALERILFARFALDSEEGYYKELEMNGYREFSGKIRAEQMVMKNIRKGSHTVVTLNDAHFDRVLPESLFDPSRFGR